ncbi:DUF1450 domain-containing protein [Paenibacillus sp. P96]|uniref:DUF1450 domain-containing protein n=1 Tax=Paenibacillus zeirhizosphaerae TaxID=2987519 RepID=A0ABT9FTP1_9BACL|nr:DUF1450 domain-containing protein [Paenibacillus sp. P96]MDP4097827.1 DUF1450 domain-containing protein [Paenibacillus sp. P96]
MKVKFCRKNLAKGSKPAYKTLKDIYQKDDDIKIKKKDCLGSCKICRTECFAVMKSEVIRASEAELLLQKLEKRISKK